MGKPADVSIRRVGFSNGTDSELRLLHAVEVPIEIERGSHRMPQHLDSYKAYARNLPSHFHDHAWLVETSGGEAVGAGYCWYNSAGDERVMECDVLVRQDRRREGIARRLMALVCDETVNEGRSLLTWSTFDSVPAGAAFSRSLAGHVARVNRTSDLDLSDVDWSMVERWASAERARERGYSLEIVDGPFPEHLRADAATFHHIMQTAPRDDLDVGDVTIDSDFVEQHDRALTRSGRDRWTVLVRDPRGVCVGGTDVIFDSADPSIVIQQNTGIDVAHRGLGLAKWVKAAMVKRVRDLRPEIRRVRTVNAYSNEAMLAINDALGFKVISTCTDWQAEVAVVSGAVHRSG